MKLVVDTVVLWLTAALAGGANAIVSEDRDLLSREAREGMRICTTQATSGMLSGLDAMEHTP